MATTKITKELITDGAITSAKLGAEFTTSAAVAAADVDFSSAQVFTKTLTEATTFTFSNDSIGMVKDLVITGDFTLTFPTGSKIAAGAYDGTVSNLIQVLVVGSADYWITISQEAV
jgi:hypothetical protein